MRHYESCRIPAEFSAGYANQIDGDVVARWEAWFRARSAKVLGSPLRRIELRYGNHPRQCMDYFPAPSGASAAPTLFAIHGGLWCLFDRWMMHFLVPAFAAAGVNVACTSYRLAPEWSLSDIVTDCHAALSYLQANAGSLPLDVSRLSVLGHSAAGQLAAVLASQVGLHRLVGVSGFYEIQPFAQSDFQPMVRFDAQEYGRWNPMDLVHAGMPPSLLITGAKESAWLHEMCATYADTLQRSGNSAERLDAEGECHFSVLAAIGDANSAVHQAVLGAIR